MENFKHQEGLISLEGSDRLLTKKVERRSFLKYAGASAAGIALLAAGCKKDNNGNDDFISLGEGDVKVLNFAYALEQLEAAFYTKVIETPNNGLSAAEASLLTDIRDHEIAHREFFKTVLSGMGMAIKDLEVDFSSINFTSRDSILGTAKAFEDLGVSAYNGAGQLLENPTYLLLAGKIVSVEARHAALIRDLISNGSFADSSVVDAQGLDISRTPQEVLAIAQPYLKTQIVL
ncbi:ferritin-like domain-containing protein [Pedobacter sp. SYSU D00535]|uniref:ferritin-like domain-containing protein n=1 Tax=Pedobacter sp. SYSU D00535 TaxID=2810308 RepID=UPI001A97AE3A|nr:ferritin-like domain-containing protein [Pedobacter sp. SYSU D00535]